MSVCLLSSLPQTSGQRGKKQELHIWRLGTTGNQRMCCHSLSFMFSVHLRFDILDQEMKTLMAQIEGVNLAANNLVESGHPRSGEVKQYQDRLNKRWDVGRTWVWGVFSHT